MKILGLAIKGDDRPRLTTTGTGREVLGVAEDHEPPRILVPIAGDQIPTQWELSRMLVRMPAPSKLRVGGADPGGEPMPMKGRVLVHPALHLPCIDVSPRNPKKDRIS